MIVALAEAIFVAAMAAIVVGLVLVPFVLVVDAPSLGNTRTVLLAVARLAFGYRLGEGVCERRRES